MRSTFVWPALRRPAGVKVTYRRMKFEFEELGFDRYWHSGSAFKSLFWTQLSTAFEPGEEFFIDSARALKDMIRDPALLEELAEFCRQEGHHTAQHLRFDKRNEAMGVDVVSCRNRYRALLDHARRRLDPLSMLAVTCALEHLTACFADQYFARPSLFEGADPKVAALWAWHAAEEAEHRATCFDIYERLGGTYGQRVARLVVAWAAILTLSLGNTVQLLANDDALWSLDALKGLHYLFGPRGVVTGLGPAFIQYLRRDFHPWNHADESRTAQWQARHLKYIQNLPNLVAVG